MALEYNYLQFQCRSRIISLMHLKYDFPPSQMRKLGIFKNAQMQFVRIAHTLAKKEELAATWNIHALSNMQCFHEN